MVNYKILVPNILSTLTAIVLKDEFLNWSRGELSENVYFYPPPFLVSELHPIKVKCVAKQ